MGQLVALGLFERAEDQTFVPTKQLREVEIERALRLLRLGTAGLLRRRGHAVACRMVRERRRNTPAVSGFSDRLLYQKLRY